MTPMIVSKQHLAKQNARIFTKPDVKKKYSRARIIQVFLNSDMRCAHNGLSNIAKDNGIKADEITPGELLVFVNRRQSMCKVLAAHNIIFHLKPTKGARIDMSCLQFLPKVLQLNGSVDYDRALEERLKERFRFFRVLN